jgi:hypothetical protein
MTDDDEDDEDYSSSESEYSDENENVDKNENTNSPEYKLHTQQSSPFPPPRRSLLPNPLTRPPSPTIRPIIPPLSPKTELEKEWASQHGTPSCGPGSAHSGSNSHGRPFNSGSIPASTLLGIHQIRTRTLENPKSDKERLSGIMR